MQGALAAQLGGALERLLGQGGVQAYCLECEGLRGADGAGPGNAAAARASGQIGGRIGAQTGWLATLAQLLHAG
ncbi:hypothetical protein ABTK87_19580, partial [Acinetobacter baumannii]